MRWARERVPEHRHNISRATKTSRQRRTYLLVGRMQEIVMASSHRLRISRLAITAGVLLGASSALASQGPGVEGGTASPLTQLVMAILVYGASAIVVGAGLIGALRGH
jgi:formate/nitrite transporter FocA (FNT family)